MGSRTKVHTALLVDIASGSVGVGLAGIRDNSRPEIIHALRLPFGKSEDFDVSHIESAMIITLRAALSRTLRDGVPLLTANGYPATINHAVVSLSSPWFIASVGKPENQFKSELEARFGTPMEVFETDGEIVSATQSKLARRIEDEIIRTFGLKNGLSLQSFTLVLNKVVNNSLKNVQSAIFVDNTDMMTDVLIQNGGHLHSIHSIPNSMLDEFWRKMRQNDAFSTGDIFMTSDTEKKRHHNYLKAVMPRARVIPFGMEDGFMDEYVLRRRNNPYCERLSTLAVFSNLFI